MELIIDLIGIFFVSWMISRFDPIDWFMDALKEADKYNIFWMILDSLISCIKCNMFWITWVMTGSLYLASGMAFVGFWYDKVIGKIENKR